MVIFDYILVAVLRTAYQLVVVFGIVIAIAVLQYLVSQGIRGLISDRLGLGYYYFVAPGVACHETGHALGCILTGTKIYEFVPFHPKPDGTLGYVSHGSPGFGEAASFIISTGPVWFGCSVILILTMLFSGNAALANVGAYYGQVSEAGTFRYILSVFAAGLMMLRDSFCFWKWSSFWFVFYLYAVFCIASEITLSGADMVGMWRGALAIVIVWFVLNLIPYVGYAMNSAILAARPYLFFVQAVMIFVLLIDLCFLVLAKIVNVILR